MFDVGMLDWRVEIPRAMNQAETMLDLALLVTPILRSVEGLLEEFGSR
jgi:hypothetical protein